MRDDWIIDKNTNKIGEKIPHNSKPEHVLLLYKQDSVGPPRKTRWWGNAGHKLALSTHKSCSDIQKTEFKIIYERANFRNKLAECVFFEEETKIITLVSIFFKYRVQKRNN